MILNILIGILFIILISLIFYGAIENFKKLRLILRTNEVSVSEAVKIDDLVQITGVAKKHKKVLNSPIENKDCLIYNYKISKSRMKNRNRDRSSWSIVEEGEDKIDFILEDESGGAYIHTDNSEILLNNTTQYTSSINNLPRNMLQNKNLSLNLENASINTNLKLSEDVIKPNDKVFIIGQFKNRNTTNNNTIEVNPDKEILISNEDTRKVSINLLLKTIFLFVGGIFVTLFIITILLADLGLL